MSNENLSNVVNIYKSKHLDTSKALNLLNNNISLYLNILEKFYKEYSDFNIKDKTENQKYIIIHTLKGLSLNIGALILHSLCESAQKKLTNDLIIKISEELNNVLNVITNILELHKKNKNKKDITLEKKKELFSKLIEASKTKLIKKCKPIVEELSNYNLGKEDSLKLEQIQNYLKRFDFKNLIKLLEK